MKYLPDYDSELERPFQQQCHDEDIDEAFEDDARMASETLDDDNED